MIIKLFFFVVGLFVLLTVATGLMLALKIRYHLMNPFLKKRDHQPSPPPGTGEIIEGEFRVLDEKQK